MAAGVLAMMPHQAGIAGTDALPTVVFATVVTTILAFAFGFPLMKSRLFRVSPVVARPLDAEMATGAEVIPLRERPHR
jgi:hypothetical protein